MPMAARPLGGGRRGRGGLSWAAAASAATLAAALGAGGGGARGPAPGLAAAAGCGGGGAEEAGAVGLPGGATVRGCLRDGVRTYRGLRFASAGRFEAPALYAHPAGEVVDARPAHEAPCVQPESTRLGLVGQEDCLFLDVYTPANASRAPVLVWIHGGGLIAGDKAFDDGGMSFAREGGLVVVTISYRLNVFGFYASPDPAVPGNVGLRDQIAALRWVQHNAESFGGDASRVTIAGQSAGGLSVMALRQSPMARGLFHRAIAQSPGWQSASQFQRAAAQSASTAGRACLEATACNSTACLRALPVAQLAGKCFEYFDYSVFLSKAGLVFAGADGEVLRDGLLHQLCASEAAEGAEVPLLVGGMPHEWRYFEMVAEKPFFRQQVAPNLVDRFLVENLRGYAAAGDGAKWCARRQLFDLYTKATSTCAKCSGFLSNASEVQLAGDLVFTIGAQLSAQAVGGPRYRYLLDVEGGGGILGATHAVDLAYFAREPDTFSIGPSGLDLWGAGIQAEAKARLGKTIREYWASFVHSGAPQSATGPDWKAADRPLGLPA